MKLVFTILGIVCFFLAAAEKYVPSPVSWFPLGWAFIAIAVLLPL